MAATIVYTKEEIESFNRQRLGVKNKEYVDDEGNKYIGIDNGWIKIKDKGLDTTFSPTVTLESENVQDAIEELDAIASTRTKQVEVDFQEDLYQTYKIFTILDEDVVAGDSIVANIAYDAPSGKELDEIEVDNIICYAGNASDGSFDLIVKGMTGSLHDKFKVNYTIQWQL